MAGGLKSSARDADTQLEEDMAMEIVILCTEVGCDNEADALWEHRPHLPVCARCMLERLRKLGRWLRS